MKHETILAYIFGFVFCSILAYAGLQTDPIGDRQFFLLRVLSALSAAGIAAVIPGFLHLNIPTGGLITVRAGGAIAVFALIFLVNPPKLGGLVTESKKAAMLANYGQELYDDALRVADEIIEKNPDESEPWNIKGGVSFYRRDYKSAVSFFKKAVELSPKSTIFQNNLAYAYIERGFYDKAIDTLKSIQDEREDWEFSIGRAYVFSGSYAEAKKHLEGVSSVYWHGAARILEAAAICGLSQNVGNDSEKTNLLKKAENILSVGYTIDKLYWDKILSGGHDKHLSYSKPLELFQECGLTFNLKRT